MKIKKVTAEYEKWMKANLSVKYTKVTKIPVEKGEKADERRWLNGKQSRSSRRQHPSAQKR